MATLSELEDLKVLSRYRHKHKPIDGVGREMWFYRDTAKWLVEEFVEMPTFYPESISNKKQAATLLKDFVTGEPFEPSINFWHMRPYENDVYELKTSDLRVFGWFARRKVFIAAVASTFEITHKANGIHGVFRDQVISMRESLDLDAPKWVVGAGASDVF